MKAYNERTDDEVLAVLKEICASSTTEVQVVHRIRNELGYTNVWLYVLGTSIGSWKLTLFAVTMYGPSGKIITFPSNPPITSN